MTYGTRLNLNEAADLIPERYVLTGGTILGGADFRPFEAVLIEDGFVRAAGTLADVTRDSRTEAPLLVDLAGAVALPGLHDTHFHMMSTGMHANAIDVGDCSSISEVIERLRDAASVRNDEWLLACNLDESTLAERRAPSAVELDAVGDRPIYIDDRGLHYSVVNSAAAKRLDLDTEAAAAGGRLQEGLSGIAKQRLGRALPSNFQRHALATASKIALANGITTVHALEGGELFDDADAFLLQEIQDELEVGIELYWGTDDVEAIAARGLRRGGGDVCIDGSLGSRTAALRRPYTDQLTSSGLLLRDADSVAAAFRKAEELGIQYGFHAIGDRAVDTAIEGARRAFPKGTALRHRIEHFGMPSQLAIAAAAELGLAIGAQPAFAFLRGQPGGVYEDRLGADRLRSSYPLRSLLEAGLIVAGGSDSDVTPADPILGIHAAVNHPQEEERISVAQALHVYTTHAAMIGGREADGALIVEGSRADITVVNANPFEVAQDRIRDIGVKATFVAGRVAHVVV